jgi:hypothetical protein
LATWKAEYEKTKAQWEWSNRVALIILDHTIDLAIRGAQPKTPSSAKEFMAKIEEHFQGSSKANASMLMTKMMNAKYTSQGSVREHIMKFIDMSNKLKDLVMPLPEPYLVHFIKYEILSPPDFSNLNHCVDCIKGKYVKHIKKGGATRSLGVLEIIHIDICGPFNVRSVDDFNSFVTFTDDLSHYAYIYLIRERSEKLDKFKIFMAEV